MIINSDLAVDLNIGEKIYITEGDLQKTIGFIVNFDDGGQTVIFKPNIKNRIQLTLVDYFGVSGSKSFLKKLITFRRLGFQLK